jgi:hypothetical protein
LLGLNSSLLFFSDIIMNIIKKGRHN